MSDCERIAQVAQRKGAGRERITQVAQDKWVTMSDLLRLLRGNERMSNLLKKIWLKNLKSCFTMFYLRLKKNSKNERIAHFCSFPLFWWVMWVNRSFHSNHTNCCERIAHFAHQKWGNEWIANFFEWISHLLIFGQKRAFCLEIKWVNSQPWRKAGVLTDNEPNYLIRIVISPIIVIFLAIILTKL